MLARMLVARSTPGDVIHSIADEGAIALWTAPSESSSSENEKLRDDQARPFTSAFAKQLGDRIPITGTLSAAMAEHRPLESHWYLGILGAHPDRQSLGLGSKVLGAMHAESDALGLPTFLESSNPRNYGFYQRHGYVETGEFTVEGSPPLRGFWRPPQLERAAACTSPAADGFSISVRTTELRQSSSSMTKSKRSAHSGQR